LGRDILSHIASGHDLLAAGQMAIDKIAFAVEISATE
jgi:hypothetical protein